MFLVLRRKRRNQDRHLHVHHSLNGNNIPSRKARGMIMQFLHLELDLMLNHVCYMYKPRTQNSFLLFHRARLSKFVKRGIATNSLQAALAKSCKHKGAKIKNKQIRHLNNPWFPEASMANLSENLVQIFTGKKKQAKTQWEDNKIHVRAYLHRISPDVRRLRHVTS